MATLACGVVPWLYMTFVIDPIFAADTAIKSARQRTAETSTAPDPLKDSAELSEAYQQRLYQHNKIREQGEGSDDLREGLHPEDKP